MIRKKITSIIACSLSISTVISSASVTGDANSITSNLCNQTTCYAAGNNSEIDIKADAKKIKQVGNLESSFLKAYKEKDLKKVKSTYKKLNNLKKYIVEPSAYKMSNGRKAAYKKIIQKLAKKSVITRTEDLLFIDGYDGLYFYGYYLADLDGDNEAELITLTGTSGYANKYYTFYSYGKNGKVKKYSTLSNGYEVEGRCAYLIAYPNHAGVILHQYYTDGNLGYSVIKIQKNKLVESFYANSGNSLNLIDYSIPGSLDDHIIGSGKIDYSDLN